MRRGRNGDSSRQVMPVRLGWGLSQLASEQSRCTTPKIMVVCLFLAVGGSWRRTGVRSLRSSISGSELKRDVDPLSTGSCRSLVVQLVVPVGTQAEDVKDV